MRLTSLPALLCLLPPWSQYWYIPSSSPWSSPWSLALLINEFDCFIKLPAKRISEQRRGNAVRAVDMTCPSSGWTVQLPHPTPSSVHDHVLARFTSASFSKGSQVPTLSWSKPLARVEPSHFMKCWKGRQTFHWWASDASAKRFWETIANKHKSSQTDAQTCAKHDMTMCRTQLVWKVTNNLNVMTTTRNVNKSRPSLQPNDLHRNITGHKCAHPKRIGNATAQMNPNTKCVAICENDVELVPGKPLMWTQRTRDNSENVNEHMNGTWKRVTLLGHEWDMKK